MTGTRVPGHRPADGRGAVPAAEGGARIVIAGDRDELSDALSDIGRSPRAVVMTMGALHEGHSELIRQARAEVGSHGSVVVTIFVNPTQFGPGEDLDEYPRPLEADIRTCEELGVDVVFAPGPDDIYPAGAPVVTVDPGPLGSLLEGAARPGHFRGVLTVVAKLIGLTRPDVAMFGEKDYQQLVLVRRMVRDLDLPVSVKGVPTVRDWDGLALSSRNSFLNDQERARAGVVPGAVAAGREAAVDGADADGVVGAARAALEAPGAGGSGLPEVDYVVVTDPDLGPAPSQGAARLLLAARVGGVRLLDNGPVLLAAGNGGGQ